jgi:RND family efflux transporter MFP subunit
MPPPVPVQIAQVESALLRETSEYLSTLKSRRSVIVQPQVSGWITSINVASGAHVTPGTVLMEIDSRRQRASVHNEEATRESKAATVVYWEKQYARLKRLLAGGGASKQEVDQAYSSLKSARADLRAQGAQVRSQSVGLQYFQVKAAETGTVGDIPVRVGDLVTTATTLTTLNHNEVLEAYINVPVARIATVRPDLPVEILDDAGKLLAPSRISFVSPEVSVDQTVLLKSWIENESNLLRNAQLVRARIIWNETRGPVIPALAVQTRNGQTFVWTVKDDAKGGLLAEQRAVQIGPIQGQSYPVLKGLALGERVVVSGLQKLRPGAHVVAAPPAAKEH